MSVSDTFDTVAIRADIVVSALLSSPGRKMRQTLREALDDCGCEFSGRDELLSEVHARLAKMHDLEHREGMRLYLAASLWIVQYEMDR